jgi:hypothetical protein
MPYPAGPSSNQIRFDMGDRGKGTSMRSGGDAGDRGSDWWKHGVLYQATASAISEA